MSRNAIRIRDGHPTKIIYGSDHALGWFLQIADNRFIGHKDDYTGEGYIVDADGMFGFTLNLPDFTDSYISESKHNIKNIVKKVEDWFVKEGIIKEEERTV